MLPKKCAAMISALLVSALPVMAHAGLHTYNFTDKPSTVRVTSSSSKFCSVTPPFFNKFTPAAVNGKPGESDAAGWEVKAICQTMSGNCEADMYASGDCNKSGAKPMAHLKIDVSTLAVKLVSAEDPYVVEVNGSTVTIRKK